MSETNTVRLYRIENPTITAQPDGAVSHEDLIGQWYTPNIGTATNYLRKVTQTFGEGSHLIEGAQLVVTDVPETDLEAFHVSKHPIASKMDVEVDNYLIPNPERYPSTRVELDDTLGDLRGNLGRLDKLVEAKQRVAQVALELGEVLLTSK